MIDRHHGHLARDGREHAIRLLDELSAGERPRWTLVDAAWTPKPAAAATQDNGSSGSAGKNPKPSDGLEPSTPSLPSGWYWRAWPGIRGHVFPANQLVVCRGVRECPHVSDLMYPSRTRDLLSVLTTENEAHGFD
jgi:hypothetical protein